MSKKNVSAVDMTHYIEQMLDKINALRNENKALRNALKPLIENDRISAEDIFSAAKVYMESGKI